MLRHEGFKAHQICARALLNIFKKNQEKYEKRHSICIHIYNMMHLLFMVLYFLEISLRVTRTNTVKVFFIFSNNYTKKLTGVFTALDPFQKSFFYQKRFTSTSLLNIYFQKSINI